MPRLPFRPLPFVLLAALPFATQAAGAPVDAGAMGVCVRATAGTSQPAGTGYAARGFHMALSSGTGTPELEAAGVRLGQKRGDLTAPVLQQAAITAAAALLQQALLAGHPHAAAPCPAAALAAGVLPLQTALLNGGAYDFNWTNATLRAGGNGTRVEALAMHADRQGDQVEASLGVHGIAPAHPIPGVRIPAPQSLDMQVSGPADRIASTLSGGLAYGQKVPFTLRAAHLALGAARFTLEGHGDVGATPQNGDFTGKLTASNFDAAIEAATEAGLTRLRTGLYLARLAARQEGDRLSWDLQWQQGILFVNNVPLPVR